MSEQSVEMVERIFDRWAASNFRWEAADVDPNVTLVVRPPLPAFGIYTGLGEIREYWRTFLEQWEHTAMEAVDIRVVGDTALVEVLQHATGRTSGIQAFSAAKYPS